MIRLWLKMFETLLSKLYSKDQTRFEIHHIYPHSMPKFSQRKMRLLKFVFPSPHLMLSHQGRNIFSASEWLIIPDMRVVPSIAMMSHLSYNNNNKVLKNIEANVSPGFIGNCKQCKETLVNKSTLHQPGLRLCWLILKEGWIINGFGPLLFWLRHCRKLSFMAQKYFLYKSCGWNKKYLSKTLISWASALP